MKALSIIGVVLSCIAVIASIATMDAACYYEETGRHFPAYLEGRILLITSLYFLSFSIVTTVKSFKKKRTDGAIKNQTQ